MLEMFAKGVGRYRRRPKAWLRYFSREGFYVKKRHRKSDCFSEAVGDYNNLNDESLPG